MPYETNADLPERIRGHLPARAQTLFREAFNSAWLTYRSDPRREEICHRVAWAAVKRLYAKADGHWMPRDCLGLGPEAGAR